MHHFGRILVACVAIGFGASAIGADKYWDYSYQNVRVVSGSKDEAKLIAHNLHRLDAAMALILAVHQADWRPKTTVYSVPAKVYTLIRGFDDGSAAIGLPGAFDDTILMNRDDRFDHAFFGAYAGYASALMSGGYSFRYPPWFIEGLAELMAAAKVEEKRVVIGGYESDRVRTLLTSTWIPSRTLLDIHQGDPQMANKDFSRLYAAECWFLVHQIIVENQYHKSFFDYFSLLDDGEPQEKAFADSFGVDYGDVDKMMHAAIDTRKLTLINVAIRDEPDSTVATALDAAQVAGLFARVALDHGTKAANASDFAKQALAADANNEDALYVLARLAMSENNYPEALTYTDRLCRQDRPSQSSESSCALLFARLALHVRDHGDLAVDEKTLAGRAASYYQSAITFDPDDVASWTGFAGLLMSARDKERSAVLLPALKHAWTLHMDNEQLARSAAGLCAMTGDYDCAYKFATVWRKHALSSASRASAEVYAGKMKSQSERQALMAAPATQTLPDPPTSSMTK